MVENVHESHVAQKSSHFKKVIKMKMWACGTLFNVLFVEPELKGKICALTAQSSPCNCAFIAAIWFSSVEAEHIELFIAKGPPIGSYFFFVLHRIVFPFWEGFMIRKKFMYFFSWRKAST